MHSIKGTWWAALIALSLLIVGSASGSIIDDDEDAPEVTARVARLSVVAGDVKIRRAGGTDWEKVVSNLPIVEGDEIATESDGFAEIQLDISSYVRLTAKSVVRFVNLKDEGIALSVVAGSAIVRVSAFDRSKTFFEIDAPQSTIAIQSSGIYRINAGSKTDNVIQVIVQELGEARVYSDNAGFTIRGGRSAAVHLEGSRAGDWEMADAPSIADDFDKRSIERDTIIAARLRSAQFDNFYDRDMFGAEDLTENGEWIRINKYGNVWRPSAEALKQYPNWSPYRYGEWRWVEPFGWTWVNDEPWGWVTYHHGRWIYEDDQWFWAPYPQKRSKRSWWSPALVLVSVINNNVCWYPLGYSHRRYDYNRHWRGRRRNNNHGSNHNPNPNPNPSPSPGRAMKWANYPVVAPGGVITVASYRFGTGSRDYGTGPASVVRTMLESPATDAPDLPPIEDVRRRLTRSILAAEPVLQRPADQRIGTILRTAPRPLDPELRNTRIFGNRPIVPRTNESIPIGSAEPSRTKPRQTGVIRREPGPTEKNQPDGQTPPIGIIPVDQPAPEPPVRPGGSQKIERSPVIQKEDDSPKYEKPTKEREQRVEPPRKEEPKYDPPKRDEPKNDPPPQRETPKSEPAPKREDPPQKSDEPKVERPSIMDRKKDG